VANGHEASCLRHENRCAKGTEGAGVHGGGVPLPGGGGVGNPPQNFFNFHLK